jgi:outer membrane receptor protein involved in Fe transport
MQRSIDMRTRLPWAVVCLLLLAGRAAAQTGTGRISGTVTDVTGAVVPGVTVTAVHVETGIAHVTATTRTGAFVFPSLPVGPYTVGAELTGFKRVISARNVLTVGADLALKLVLEPGAMAESVTVSGAAARVQTTESSLSTLVPQQDIQTLPLNGRNPLHLIGLVPGVVGHSAEATASGGTATHYINGDRGRGITTTQDGIDISDPVIPRGELTNSPVNPDALQEFRVITSNAKAEYGRTSGGQVELVTRTGTNALHGTVYEFLRNTGLDANSYFNERQGLPTEVLRRNQFGASVGGPIIKNKAFFFANYEGQRRTQETSQLVTVPTAALRGGLFRFVTQPCAGQTAAQNRPSCVDATGNPLVPVSSYNFAANDPRGLGLDRVMQEQILKFLPLPNDFTIGDGLNTAGYRWNSPSEAPVDTLTARVDYNFNERHSLFARYSTAFRNDLINDIINTTPRPLSWPARVRLSDQQGTAVGLKSTFGPHLLNEVTLGFTRNVLDFADPEHPKTYEICRAGCIFTSPFVYWPGTSRKPMHLQMLDNVSWVRGAHTLKTGVNVRLYYVDQTRGAGNPFGIYPSFTFGRLDAAFSGLNTLAAVRPDGTRVDLSGSGINGTDRNNLSTLYNVMLGRIGRVDQVFYSNGREFPPLNPLTLKQRFQEYNAFVQDDWRVTPRLTFNLGLRYELNTVPYDTSGVQVVNDRPLDGSQGAVSFVPAGPGTGRQWFRTDSNNFAPSVGFAWDPYGNARMAVRGSYRLAYQRLVSWALNVVEQRQPATSVNQFLQAPRNPALGGSDSVLRLEELLHGGVLPPPQRGTNLTLVNGVPQLSAPPEIPRTPGNNRNEQPLFFDKDVVTPYVQQWTLGVQRELAGQIVVDLTYVGNRGVNLFRMVNVNQMDLLGNGFVRDFQAAQRNLQRSGNPNAGEPTGNLGRLFGGAIPTSVYGDLQNGNVGQVADALDRGTLGVGLSRAGLPDNFFRPNPQFSLAGLGCTCSNSWYNALQVQVHRRFTRGLTVMANYTLSKSTDDVSHDTRGAGTELVVPTDPHRPELDKARSDYDVRHVFRGSFIWDLPVGRGKRFLGRSSGLVDAVLGGWQLNGIVDASSGFPFGVYSGYQTFTFYDGGTRVASVSANAVSNRAVYTGGSRKIGRVVRTPAGAEFFSSEERDLFSAPAPGETGSGRNLFTGPGFFQMDLGLFKYFTLGGDRRLELRVEVFNLFNTVNFNDPTFLMTSGSFGNITDTRVPPRIVQLGLKLHF